MRHSVAFPIVVPCVLMIFPYVFVLLSSDPDALSQFFDPNSCPVSAELDDTVCIDHITVLFECQCTVRWYRDGAGNIAEENCGMFSLI